MLPPDRLACRGLKFGSVRGPDHGVRTQLDRQSPAAPLQHVARPNLEHLRAANAKPFRILFRNSTLRSVPIEWFETSSLPIHPERQTVAPASSFQDQTLKARQQVNLLINLASHSDSSMCFAASMRGGPPIGTPCRPIHRVTETPPHWGNLLFPNPHYIEQMVSSKVSSVLSSE